MIRRLFLLPLLALLLAPATALAQIAPEDVLEIRNVANVVISPDGDHVAYTVSHPRAAEDPVGPAYSELFIAHFVGGEPIQITQRPQLASQPAWVDDARLAFISRVTDEHAMAQVYTVHRTGGELQRITDAPEGVSGFEISADGSRIFYTARQPENPEVVRRREQGFDEKVFGEDVRHVQLYAQPLPAGERIALTPAHMSVREFAVSPDGQSVALQMTEGVTADDDLMFRQTYVVPATGGELTPLAPTEGKLGMMAWSPNSSRVAFLSATRLSDPLAHLIYIAVPGQGVAETPMADYEGTVEWLAWEDGNTILFAAVEGTRTTLNRLDLNTGVIDRVLGGGLEIMRNLSVAADGDHFAAAVNTRNHPNELYVGHLSEGDFTRLTDHNPWLAERRFARQETIEWTGAEGERIEGVLVYPLDYVEGQAYPLAILPHGGPEGISIDGWNTRALYPAHVMALEGYVVLKPNYRGSGGRGPAFSMANHRDLGGTEFEDVLLGIDHLAAEGLVDPDRVGISGTSYGGYFSAWATTRYPERFRAGITFAGLSNWLSFMGTTDIPHEMALVHWDLYWYEDPDLYNDRSPVFHIDENTSPTLVVHGMVDERVHLEQSLQLYNLLRLRDVPTGLVFYPREPHGLLERAHQLDFMHRMIDWFETYVRPVQTAVGAR
jgi:dipeptidyl aminopeptidase/acylaminoacyl peptidase